MSESDLDIQYKQEFTERVATARIARNLKQWQAAEALGIPQDKYKQYEGRSLMPHRLIGRFCIICRVDPGWLITGRGQKPLKPLELILEEAPEAVRKPKKARSKRVA